MIIIITINHSYLLNLLSPTVTAWYGKGDYDYLYIKDEDLETQMVQNGQVNNAK